MEKTNECKEFNDFKSEIDRMVENMKKDIEKFYVNENMSAGVRIRKSLKAMKQYVHSVSNETLPKNKK